MHPTYAPNGNLISPMPITQKVDFYELVDLCKFSNE